MPEISIIIINYNTSSHTINCINSLVEKIASQITYEFIIIDNASATEDYKKLKTQLDELNIPNLTLFRSRINTGFGGGNMMGVQFAKGKYYAFVNNDVLLENDCISIIYDFFRFNKDAIIAAPQQYDENNKVQPAFDYFITLRKLILGRSFLQFLNPQKYPKREKIYEEPIKVDAVPGSFLVVRADKFDEVGGFDTNIFLYYEEIDLCYRIHKMNESKDTCYLVPNGKYIHLNGKSTVKNKTIKRELKLSLNYVYRKHNNFLKYIIFRFYFITKYFFKTLFNYKNYYLLALFLYKSNLSFSLKSNQKIDK